MADVLNPNSTEGRLALFLRETAGRRMAWGRHDCGLWLADWIAYWRGAPDPAADVRGRYDSSTTFHALTRAPYPLVIGRLVRRAGWRCTTDPQVGAVGVVVAPASPPAGAIRTPGGWALLSAHGFVRLPAAAVRVLRAWEPAECRT